MSRNKEKLTFNCNDALYRYIKSEAKRYHIPMTSLIDWMMNQTFSHIPKEDLTKYMILPIEPSLRTKYMSSVGHVMYLSLNTDTYMKILELVDTGPGRETISKCIRLLIVKYIELNKKGEI